MEVDPVTLLTSFDSLDHSYVDAALDRVAVLPQRTSNQAGTGAISVQKCLVVACPTRK